MIPGVVAHLWQSTLFAGTAWLLTLALRKNKAQVRYRIWFIASAKFLVPFSLLVGLGTLVPRREVAPPIQIGWVVAAEQLGQPLFTIPSIAAQVAVTSHRTNRNYFAAAALTLWACGLVTIAICWLVRWQRVRALRKSATPVIMPGGLQLAVPVMSVPGLVEPGIFGIFRPVLLLPEGIQEQLDHAQLEAILAHELCHVHRRDNLTAAIHMVVQATFWVHPLVWWLGARLVDERERACDEEVLRLGSKPQVYAAGILSICKLYVETPMVCVSGVTGANLKSRIEAIMKNRIVLTLNFPRKAALTAAGVAALVLPIVVGVVKAPSVRAQSGSPHAQVSHSPESVTAQGMSAQSHAVRAPVPPVQMAQVQQPPVSDKPKSQPATTPKFDVASIKLNKDCGGGPGRSGGAPARSAGRLRMNCVSVQALIGGAYVVLDANGRRPARGITIEGGPAWTESELYAIEAEADGAPGEDVMRGPMMQALLEDRFHLKIHRETREIPVYVLTIAKGGPKLRPFQEGSCTEHVPGAARPGPDEKPWCGTGGMRTVRNGRNVTWDEVGASFLNFSVFLGIVLDRPVIDKTGITGTFDFHLEFAPDETTAGVASPFAPDSSSSGAPSDPAGGPSIFTAFQEQLGLKLEAGKGPSEVLVIDHVERPSDN